MNWDNVVGSSCSNQNQQWWPDKTSPRCLFSSNKKRKKTKQKLGVEIYYNGKSIPETDSKFYELKQTAKHWIEEKKVAKCCWKYFHQINDRKKI